MFPNGTMQIAVIGPGVEEDIVRPHEAGFVAHLVKPVHKDEVCRVFSQLGSAKYKSRIRSRSGLGGEWRWSRSAGKIF
jgi:hypothetical protein